MRIDLCYFSYSDIFACEIAIIDSTQYANYYELKEQYAKLE